MARNVKTWPAIVCLLVAAGLEVMPLPDVLTPWRPPFAAIALIYWVMMWPNRVNLGTAFIIGLILDLLHGNLLGQNALSLSVITYLVMRFHLQIRIFPVWQLMLTIFAMLAINAFIQLWIDGVAGIPPAGITRWTQVLSGTILWPVLMGIMDWIRIGAERDNARFTY